MDLIRSLLFNTEIEGSKRIRQPKIRASLSRKFGIIRLSKEDTKKQWTTELKHFKHNGNQMILANDLLLFKSFKKNTLKKYIIFLLTNFILSTFYINKLQIIHKFFKFKFHSLFCIIKIKKR